MYGSNYNTATFTLYDELVQFMTEDVQNANAFTRYFQKKILPFKKKNLWDKMATIV